MSHENVYLAGPEVFLPDAAEIGSRKKALCAEFGFVGLFPLDNVVLNAAPHERISRLIFAGNVALMGNADLVIANLTPFRGPSADAGTVFEMGLMMGMGKLVLGYTNGTSDLLTRTRKLDHRSRFDEGMNAWVDCVGMVIEDFGQADNLMITECLEAGGIGLVERIVAPTDLFRDLGGFRECLRLARARLL